MQEAKHPEVMIFKNYTPLDLLPFDGLGKEGRILMAVNGSIYDVTRGRNFYGPGRDQFFLLREEGHGLIWILL